MLPNHEDIRLGLMVVERGYVTPGRVREALSVLAADPVRRTLGTVLVAMGLLTDVRLVELLGEMDGRSDATERAERKKRRLGALLVGRGLVPVELVDECVRLQDRAREEKRTPVPRLGEFLVERRYAAPSDIRDALATQRKSILVCYGCNRRYNVVDADPVRFSNCPECGVELRPTHPRDSVHVDRTATRLAAV